MNNEPSQNLSELNESSVIFITHLTPFSAFPIRVTKMRFNLKALFLLASATNGFQVPTPRNNLSLFVTPTGSLSSNLDNSQGINRKITFARSSTLSMSTSTEVSSWEDITALSNSQPIGAALNNEVEVRKTGKASPHVQSKLRLFASDEKPKITLYRDHAGWCK